MFVQSETPQTKGSRSRATRRQNRSSRARSSRMAWPITQAENDAELAPCPLTGSTTQ